MLYDNILQTIGNTPLVKLSKKISEVPATVYAKVETFNPGNSIKDRIAIKMIEVAESTGQLKPGGTIIEGTSGNTGMGLALVCIIKGYKLICTMPDKQSKEKMDILRAVGAQVVVTPTNVAADDPRSYYSVAKQLALDTPNSFYVDQYNNLANRQAHYEGTGPEIWEQTKGKITHLVVGAGTGGTITGCAMYLKEKNPAIKIWAIDTYGSALKKYHETGKLDKNEIYSYLTEGIGEDIIPDNYNFSMIDHFEKVSDKDGMLMTREIAQKEGIFVGNSAGCAIAGLNQMKDKLTKNDFVVVIFHDHGSRYVGKIFNDDWMRERGFMANKKITLQDIISKTRQNEDLIYIDSDQSVANAIGKITNFNVSQLPVMKEGEVVGSISESQILNKIIDDPTAKLKNVEEIMQAPFPTADLTMSLEQASGILNENHALLVKDELGKLHIITKQDVIHTVAG